MATIPITTTPHHHQPPITFTRHGLDRWVRWTESRVSASERWAVHAERQVMARDGASGSGGGSGDNGNGGSGGGRVGRTRGVAADGTLKSLRAKGGTAALAAFFNVRRLYGNKSKLNIIALFRRRICNHFFQSSFSMQLPYLIAFDPNPNPRLSISRLDTCHEHARGGP